MSLDVRLKSPSLRILYEVLVEEEVWVPFV